MHASRRRLRTQLTAGVSCAPGKHCAECPNFYYTTTILTLLLFPLASLFPPIHPMFADSVAPTDRCCGIFYTCSYTSIAYGLYYNLSVHSVVFDRRKKIAFIHFIHCWSHACRCFDDAHWLLIGLSIFLIAYFSQLSIFFPSILDKLHDSLFAAVPM